MAAACVDRLPELGKTGSTAVANAILSIVHSLTFAPLFIVLILHDAHLKLAIVLNTALCVCLTAANYCFYRMGVVKIYPKMLDTFLLIFYGSMIAIAYKDYDWLKYWISLYHHGSVACFMWLSILLPCWDNFAMEALKDRLPEQLWQLQGVFRTGLHASQAWAGALTIMALTALVPTLTNRTHIFDASHIVCDYVIGLLSLLAAVALQRWVVSHGVGAAYLWQQQGDAEAGMAADHSPAGPFAASSSSSASRSVHDCGAARDLQSAQDSSVGRLLCLFKPCKAVNASAQVAAGPVQPGVDVCCSAASPNGQQPPHAA